MPLFGKHTKSAELGKMAQSLGTGALAALTTKGSGQDPYTQSGGITEGGEEGGGGPTGMERLGAFAAGMGSKGYMDYLGKTAQTDYTSAMAKRANEAAAKAKLEREQESIPWNISEATGQLDSTGALETKINKLAELGGHNANGGAFTRKEYSEAIKKPGFASEIARAIEEVNKPLGKLMGTQERELQEGLARYKDETTGKVDIEQIMSNPDVLGENPKLAKVYENWKSNQARYEKSAEGLAYYERMASRAAPITMEQMKASAAVQGIADLQSAHPGMTKQEATGIFLATSGWGLLQQAISTATGGHIPRTEAEVDAIEEDVLEVAGMELFPKSDFIDPEIMNKALKEGLKRVEGIQEKYAGGGSSKDPVTVPGQDGGVWGNMPTPTYDAGMNADA